jgi:hypothetical protein
LKCPNVCLKVISKRTPTAPANDDNDDHHNHKNNYQQHQNNHHNSSNYTYCVRKERIFNRLQQLKMREKRVRTGDSDRAGIQGKLLALSRKIKDNKVMVPNLMLRNCQNYYGCH